MLDFLKFAMISGVGGFIVGIVLFVIDYAKQNSKKSSVTVMLVSIGISLLALGIFTRKVNHDNEVERQASIEQAQAAKQIETEFKDSYRTFRSNAIEVGASSEKIGNKVTEVWHDAIWNSNGVKIDNQFYTDFNKAIKKQLSIYIGDGTMAGLTKAESEMDHAYLILKKNKTSENEESFTQATTIRAKAKKMLKLVTEPSGNYRTFSNKLSDADSELSTALD